MSAGDWATYIPNTLVNPFLLRSANEQLTDLSFSRPSLVQSLHFIMASRGRRREPRFPTSESQSGPTGTSGTPNSPAAPSVGSPPAAPGFMPQSPFPARLVAMASDAMKDLSHAQAIPDSEKRRSNATWAPSLVGGKITPVGAQATTRALPAAGPSTTGQSMKSRERVSSCALIKESELGTYGSRVPGSYTPRPIQENPYQEA